MSTIYRKVLADLWSNKARTVLTVLTITVGVFAVGAVGNLNAMVVPDMQADYQSTNPHGAIIYCAPFDEDLLPPLRQVPGVGEVEGRSRLVAQALPGGERKITVEIVAIPPVADMRISRIQPIEPGDDMTLADHQVFVEHSARSGLPLEPGDVLPIELPDGTVRRLRFAHFVHDPTQIAYTFSDRATLYVTQDTMLWLGGSWDYNQMLLTVIEHHTDHAHVSAVAQAVADRIERSGRQVYQTFIYQPGQHWCSEIVQGVSFILAVLGVLTVFLSGFLVFNTVMGLLKQQVRQIGIMKTVGGRTRQIITMYIGQVLGFGALAFLIAVPLSAYVGYQVDLALAGFLNFRPGPFRLLAGPIVLQAAIALVSPVVAALAPVLNAAHITVREAIGSYGLAKVRAGGGLIDQGLERVRFLSRPLLLSLRNTFRRKRRLILTLSTLTLGGAIFISVFNLWVGLDDALRHTIGFLNADVTVSLAQPYRMERVAPLITSIPGVARLEGWRAKGAQLLSAGGQTALEITFLAPPGEAIMDDPVMIAGRWLVPEDENAVVIGNHVIQERPDLAVGDPVTIEIGDKESVWHIVGIYKLAGRMTPPIVFANKEYLSWLQNEVGLASELYVTTFPQDGATQHRVREVIQARFEQAGIPLIQVQTRAEFTEQQASSIDVLVYFLLVMAVLVATVGGLGLMGTMSMNVLERTREIGVMRAVGASSQAILTIVVAEGVLVGVISWGLAVLFSLPITYVLAQGVGIAVLTVPVDFVINWPGVGLWLAGVVGIAALASAAPARSAARLTIREVLAYE